MPGFLKHFKMKALTNGRFGRYLIYALGEVILVVLGILIALQINNNNEEEKQRAQFNNVLQNIAVDLAQDTVSIYSAKQYYGARQTVATDILTGKYDSESIKKCFLCKSLVSTYLPIKLNDKGYLLLRNFNGPNQNTDTLAIQISQFYNTLKPLVDEFGEEVKENAMTNIKDWRDTKPWFSEMLRMQQNEGFDNYLMSGDYKNKVVYYNNIVSANYLTMLKQYDQQGKYLLAKINTRLEKTSD